MIHRGLRGSAKISKVNFAFNQYCETDSKTTCYGGIGCAINAKLGRNIMLGVSTIKVIFSTSLVTAFLASVLSCQALEPRFYSALSDPSTEINAVFNNAATADRTISCNGLDEIDVGIGEERKAGPRFVTSRFQKYFRRSEVHHFLKSEKHKDLLVIWFEKPIMWQGADKVQSILLEFKNFVSDLGYKRVLILGCHAEGVFVVYDSSEKPNDYKPIEGK